MRYPFNGTYPITSPFGWRGDPFGGAGREFHDAVDFGTPSGTPILAATDGTVTLSKFSTLYGNYIELTESAEIMTRYSHLSRVFVRKGQKVVAGQVIAESGNTGRSSGPHLDFAVFKYGKAVDPMPYLQPENNDDMFKDKLIQSINSSTLDSETKRLNAQAVREENTDYLVTFLGAEPRAEADRWKQRALECEQKPAPDCKAAVDAAIQETEAVHKAKELELSALLEAERAKNVNSSTKSPLASKKVWVTIASIVGVVAVQWGGADESTVNTLTEQLISLLDVLGIAAIPVSYNLVQGRIDEAHVKNQ